MSRYQAYPEYKDSGLPWLGEIPSSWQIIYSKAVFSERNLKAQLDDEQLTASQKYGILPQKLFMEMEQQKVVQVLKGHEILKKVEVGDFVISMRSFQGGIEYSPYSGSISSAYVPLFPKKNISKLFFKYFLKSAPYIQALQSTTNLVRDGQALRYGNFTQVPLPVFDFEEQENIGKFLDHETAKIDTLIEQQQQLIQLLKEKRQAVISHAVTKGLNPNAPMKDSGVDWLGEVPEHWEVIRLKFLADYVTSGSRGWAEYYSEEGDLFFRIANLTRDTIEPKLESLQFVTVPDLGEGTRAKIEINDLLISITADLGSVCVANSAVAGGYVSQHVSLVRPNNKVVSSHWLGFYILSDIAKEQLLGSGYGGTKIQLSLEDIKELWVVKPTKNEQIDIEKYLDAKIKTFFSLIALAEHQIEILKERRSALISAAVTGKIDVRNWQAPTHQ